ncbi:PTS sugar transporter subunit IIA [Lactococcus sp. S64]|uniref:PTS fructose transporter subunit IIABC n=1 Tax=Lactococcus sp. S64 TaxID=2767459 RepID=UPI001906289F|nr:PTS fructose transporter subunit IIABC [Lactococcus sp. S64]MBK0084483.1 PTS sugar transporter subunit IIA [Lactococcus sp. S64]
MKKIVAITSCPVGIAHTYMAAENLEKAGKQLGIEVKVETHGSIGVENELSKADIDEAVGVIIAADTKIDKSRFGGKQLIEVGVQDGIHQSEELVQKILNNKAEIYQSSETEEKRIDSNNESLGKKIYKSLMNGVSYMVPFVVTGGLLIAISLSLGGKATPTGIQIPAGTIWATMNTIGTIAMGLMVPILSAFIAQSIADRPGLVPGFIGGMLAANGSLYGSTANAGFIGGIITGFLAGFIVLGIKKLPIPKALQSIMPIIVIPIIASLIVGFLFIYIIGGPVAWLFTSLTGFLASMQGGSEVILAMILGAMIAFDMGGPFNKVAFLFGSGLIAEGNYSIMGPIAVAICIPPLALGVASLVLKNKFTKAEKEAGKASLAMGLFGITEGAIPFASTDPLRTIPSIVLGAMTGSVIAMLSGVTDHVAHGGPIVAVLGAVDHVAMFFIAVVSGIVVTVIVLRFLKPNLQLATVSGPVETNNKNENLSFESAQVTSKPNNDFGTIADLLYDNTIILDLPEQSKNAVISELAQELVNTGNVTELKGFETAIHERENESTTGIGMGIAIPHGKSSYVKKPTLAFARSDKGIEWCSLDGSPAQLIFMIAVPENSKEDIHLKILQQLSRKLMDSDFRQQLLKASDKNEVKGLLSKM